MEKGECARYKGEHSVSRDGKDSKGMSVGSGATSINGTLGIAARRGRWCCYDKESPRITQVLKLAFNKSQS